MRFTKFTHACARLEAAGTTLVIDPGTFSEPDVLHGANAVLITHEHFDHFDPDRLRAAVAADAELTVWTNGSVAAQLADLGDRVHTVAHGDAFTVGGVDVHVYGEKHAALLPDREPPTNIGFLIGGTAFYPGDAFTVPEEPVGTLLTPTDAPWLRRVDLVPYIRSIGAPRALSMHDGLLNEIGLSLVDQLMVTMGEEVDGDYRRLTPGEDVELD